MRKIIFSLLAYAAWQWLNKPARPAGPRRRVVAGGNVPGGRAHRG